MKEFTYYCPVYHANISILLVDDVKFDDGAIVDQINEKVGSELISMPRATCIYSSETDESTLVFRKSDLNLTTILHEVIHLRQNIFSTRGLYNDGHGNIALDEAEAYFESSIFQQVVTRLRKFINFDDFLETKSKML